VVNAVALVALALNWWFGAELMSPAVQDALVSLIVAVLPLVNIGLRFATEERIRME